MKTEFSLAQLADPRLIWLDDSRAQELITQSVPVYYITGNHDDALRRYSPAQLGNLYLCDRLELSLGGERYWFFHGDIFDERKVVGAGACCGRDGNRGCGYGSE